MPSETTPEALYERLMEVCRAAHGAGLYSAAYHALAGAMHCARAMPDDAALAAVIDLARAQLAEIDQRAPEYEHSTRSSIARGHDNIFATLARQGQITIDMRRTDRLRADWDQAKTQRANGPSQ